jgi:uncharacterized circularly permuted ATP-grasp superfamily protein/uncharacterized alpha-E superfamily protein
MLTTSPNLAHEYHPHAGVHDELMDAEGRVRGSWSYLVSALDALGLKGLRERKGEVDRLLRQDGVTYNIHGDPAGMHTPWALDPIPMLLASSEWHDIERGIAQRAELFDLLLADVYGRRSTIARGDIPPELIYAHDGFLRPCDGIVVPHTRQLFLYAADLARDSAGNVCVLADRTQAPTGAGYAHENRLVVSRVFPSVYRDSGVHRLAPFFRALRSALVQAAPVGVDDPRVVILTPGRWNEAYFEHAHLATSLGYSLVEGADLTVRDGKVWLRALGGLEQVDVIVRRVDGAYCDPLELRADSQLGVPGLVDVARRGRVSVVNPIGSAVLENPALVPLLPALCRALLGEELILPAVDTWWCGEPAGKSHVLANIDTLVIKPINRHSHRSSIPGWRLDAEQRADLVAQIQAQPHLFVGQLRAVCSSTPTLDGDRLAPQATVLRTYAVARADEYLVMTGGLARVAENPDDLLVSSHMAGLTKDTWVIASEPELPEELWISVGPDDESRMPSMSMSSRAAENLFWLGRYAERAEGTIRLFRCISDRQNDLAGGTNPAGVDCLRGLLAAFTHVTATYPGFTGDGAEARFAMPDETLRSSLLDPRRSGSLVASLRGLLAAADAVRDQLSTDTWLVVSNLGQELVELQRPDADLNTSVRGVLAGIIKSLLALSGLATESMVRDPGWQFLDAGRRIERAQMTVGLLRATVVPVRSTAAESLMFESVLSAAESIITYRRRYRSRAQLETLLDLVVLDRTNPRSISYQLDRLIDDVDNVPRPASHRLQPDQRLVLDLRTRVQLADTGRLGDAATDNVRWDLDHFLSTLSTMLADTSDAIDRANFAHVGAPEAFGQPGLVPPTAAGSTPPPAPASPRGTGSGAAS